MRRLLWLDDETRNVELSRKGAEIIMRDDGMGRHQQKTQEAEKCCISLPVNPEFVSPSIFAIISSTAGVKQFPYFFLLFTYVLSTAPFTFSLTTSTLSRPSLSTTFTAILCSPALNLARCLPSLSIITLALKPVSGL